MPIQVSSLKKLKILKDFYNDLYNFERNGFAKKFSSGFVYKMFANMFPRIIKIMTEIKICLYFRKLFKPKITIIQSEILRLQIILYV